MVRVSKWNDEEKISEWLKETYSFLKRHRQFNQALQKRFYVSIALGSVSAKRRLLSLVWNVSQTQSQAKIDKLGWTLRKLEEITSESADSQLVDFLGWMRAIIREMNSCCHNGFFSQQAIRVFEGLNIDECHEQSMDWQAITDILSSMPGFGYKTGRLLAKSIYHCGCSGLEYLDESQLFLTNVPRLKDDDRIQLPVDNVILELFTYAFGKKGINSRVGSAQDVGNRLVTLAAKERDLPIKGLYHGASSEVWDDLWFWGFISQKGTADRVHEFNLNKYLCLEFAQRDEETIKELKSLSDEFVRICS